MTSSTPPQPEALERARRLVEQGLAIADAWPDDPNSNRKWVLLAGGYRNLGILAQMGGRYAVSLQVLTKSSQISSTRGLVTETVGTQYQLGLLARVENRLDDATRAFQEVYEISRRDRIEAAHAASAWMLGRIAAERNQVETAEPYLSEAVIIYERLRSPHLSDVRGELEKVRRRVEERRAPPRAGAAPPAADDAAAATPSS